MSAYGISSDALRSVFPFHLVVDRALRLVQVGDALARICPEFVVGLSMAERVRLIRPDVPLAFDDLLARRRALFVIELLPMRLPLRGQLLPADDGEHLTFLCSPWITKTEQLATFGLALTDFPTHEPIADYLFLLQSQATALQEAQTLAARLETQAHTLRDTNAALEEKESMLRAVLDTAADGIVSIDADGIIRAFSAAASGIFGYAPGDVIGQPVDVVLTLPERPDSVPARFEAAMRGGREMVGRRPDGSPLPVHVALSEITLGADRLYAATIRDLTAEREVAANLSATERRLSQTLDALRAGVWELDAVTGETRWSSQQYTLLGYRPDEVPASPDAFFERVHPDDQPTAAAELRRVLATAGEFEYEWRVVLPDGGTRWLRNLGAALADDAGRVRLVSGLSLDITDRRRAEIERDAERERSERIAAAQFAVAGVLAETSDLHEAIPRIMAALCTFLHWDWSALWVPRGDALECEFTWARRGAQHDAFREESSRTRFTRGSGLPGRVWRDGEPAWIADVQKEAGDPRRGTALDAGLRSAFALPVLSRGVVIGVLEFFSAEARERDVPMLTTLSALSTQLGDFMERLDGERRLRASEERMRLIVDTSLDGVISMDEDGVVTLWSPQATAIFGWTAQEAVGRDLGELIVPQRLREAHNRGLAQFVASGRRRNVGRRIEVPACHKDGHEFPIELAIGTADTQQVDADTATDVVQRRIFSAFVRDITARRQAEADLRRAKDEAEAASRARAEFLAMMSHELRTPLHGVIGMLDLLRETRLDGEQQRQIDVARRSAKSLVAITNDILDFSKIAAGRLVIEPHPFDLGRLVDEIAATFRPQAEAAGVEVRVEFPDGRLRGVTGDSVRVGQILTNLVGNAVKFTERGEVVLTLTRLRRGDVELPEVQCLVRDTGVGIPADKREVIFDAFAQAEATTTRKYGGTGLGLPISARLAEAMAGQLTLAATSTHGSTFALILPLPACLLQEEQASQEHASLPAGARVLLVEDHLINQEIASSMLTSLGCAVTVAADGTEAVDAVMRESFDLVFMDCLMPTMDGFEATRRIRALGHTQLPILAMTASAFPEDRARCFEAGMNDHLTKPLLDGALKRALAQWLPRPTLPVLDETRVQQAVQLATATMVGWGTFVDRFVGDAEQAIDRLDRALEEGTVEALRAEAHALRRSSATVAALRLEAACADLEQACHDDDADGLARRVASVSAELDSAVEALRAVATSC